MLPMNIHVYCTYNSVHVVYSVYIYIYIYIYTMVRILYNLYRTV